MTSFSKHRLVFLRFLVLGFAAALFAPIAKAAAVKFDIPAGPARDGIEAFIQQSGTHVLFGADDVKGLQTNAVSGTFEVSDALSSLLKGTALSFKQQKEGWFVVVKIRDGKGATGSVKGSLTWADGSPAYGVNVYVKETSESIETDKRGEFVFQSLAPGTHELVARSEGYQPMEIDNVVVDANRELTLKAETMRKAEDTTKLEPYVVQAEGVTTMEQYLVTDTKPQPFSDRNVDIPRSVDDVQPYYIFDSGNIDQSGATTTDDFIKQMVTMNTQYASNAQQGANSNSGNTSEVNLRGLGANETLVLVDGRRMAGVTASTSTAYSQPDLNGIPLAAIDHIEVLPSSAAGIYGANALGGVINVVLKKNYSGGEIRVDYENTWGSNAPSKSYSINYGQSFENGKTQISFTAQYSDAIPLVVGDRANFLNGSLSRILKNEPNFLIGSGGSPYLGSEPNIGSVDFVSFDPNTGEVTFQGLTLKANGSSLGSSIATLPPGYSANTSPSSIIGGTWNFIAPPTNQGPNGTEYPFTATPRNKSVMLDASREMTKWLELFVDYSYASNYSSVDYNPLYLSGSNSLYVPSSSPANPFNQDVTVSIPESVHAPEHTLSTTTTATFGAKIKLPEKWVVEADYTWSSNRLNTVSYGGDDTALDNDLQSGALNPFVDTLKDPLDLSQYLTPVFTSAKSTLNDAAIRSSGPLPGLPWGIPTLSLSVEHQLSGTPGAVSIEDFPITTAYDNTTNFFGQSEVINSGYVELNAPLIDSAKKWFLLKELDLQVAGRIDSYKVTTGTTAESISPGQPISYDGPTDANGNPFTANTVYRSINSTFGLRWRPTADITLRASHATAFLPPDYGQLVPNVVVDPFTTTITDPKNGSTYNVQTLSGGNPNLKPQTSRSWNVGAIWEPRGQLMSGLRIDVEFYQINQYDEIGSLSAQQIIDSSSQAGRVTRDPTTGLVTLVNTSLVNLTEADTSGIDVSLSYNKNTAIGNFGVDLRGTVIIKDERQDAPGSPKEDYVGYVDQDGGETRTKANGTFRWNRNGWTAGWTTRFYSSYYAWQATPGDPSWGGMPNYGAFGIPYYTQLQGSDRIPSQIYHDLFLRYAFGKDRAKPGSTFATWGARALDGLSVIVGIKDVFGTEPPFDAQAGSYYYSYYGSINARTYWVSIRKQF
jgi:outer membrane receptor protein involved in Fe transport